MQVQSGAISAYMIGLLTNSEEIVCRFGEQFEVRGQCRVPDRLDVGMTQKSEKTQQSADCQRIVVHINFVAWTLGTTCSHNTFSCRLAFPLFL